MNPALVGQILQYMTLVPQGVEVISNLIAAYKKLAAEGPVTQDKLDALAQQIMDQHNALPKPE